MPSVLTVNPPVKQRKPRTVPTMTYDQTEHKFTSIPINVLYVTFDLNKNLKVHQFYFQMNKYPLG